MKDTLNINIEITHQDYLDINNAIEQVNEIAWYLEEIVGSSNIESHHQAMIDGCLTTIDFMKLVSDGYNVEQKRESDLASKKIYTDYGHVDGVKEYTQAEAVEAIKEILKEDEDLSKVQQHDVDLLTDEEIIEAGMTWYQIEYTPKN